VRLNFRCILAKIIDPGTLEPQKIAMKSTLLKTRCTKFDVPIPHLRGLTLNPDNAARPLLVPIDLKVSDPYLTKFRVVDIGVLSFTDPTDKNTMS
jgi:hypothetical protein